MRRFRKLAHFEGEDMVPGTETAWLFKGRPDCPNGLRVGGKAAGLRVLLVAGAAETPNVQVSRVL